MRTGDLCSSPTEPETRLEADDEEVLEEEDVDLTLPLTSAPARAIRASAASADSPMPSSRSLFSSAVSVCTHITENSDQEIKFYKSL